MNARAVALTGFTAFIILCGICIGVHLNPIMGKLRAAATATSRSVPAGERPRATVIQEAVDRALTGKNAGFAPGTAALTIEAQKQLDGIYPILLSHPELQLEVRGFPDGPSAQSPELGRQRAEAVRAYLIFRGIDGERISSGAAVAAEAQSIPACRFALIMH